MFGSNRAYKSSNNLRVDSKVHNYEITGQWHLEGVSDDGKYRHLYCDLVVKKENDDKPVALLELLVTASSPTLEEHYEQVLRYAQQLCPLEVWVVHFSREDDVAKSPYWPREEKRINVVHFWHDKDFSNVRMSYRTLDNSGGFKEVIDAQVLP
ncbi:19096_t:CDS:2 [Racocetra persica]|uniref:19096_t:CDS:1 n=1 Tax=Racocetra persica TaxID=160502 RepID=A0ACA9RJS6_9GLOM|nr:19096_t:CDS:2 [Racocetra persica]